MAVDWIGWGLCRVTTLLTARLRLEPCAEHHLDGLHAMNSRPEVMRFLSGRPETEAETLAFIGRVQRCWAAWGTSWWSFVELGSERVVGAGCIQYLRREALLPADLQALTANPLEIGWRLHPDHWGRGLASEAARCMAAFAFERFGVAELLSVRHPENIDSGRVMERLGMHFRGIESWYGSLVATHALSREAWLARAAAPVGS